MLIKRPADIASSEITPESVFLRRREVMKGLGGFAAIASSQAAQAFFFDDAQKAETDYAKLEYQLAKKEDIGKGFVAEDQLTPFGDVTRYNNFYEFGTDKADPMKNAQNFQTKPWEITIDGEVEKPGKIYMEDLLKRYTLQERIYRLRCVEAWSMVIPWVGIPLVDFIKDAKPTSKAKYVKFTTLYDPKQMPGQRSRFSTIDWPYVEGLRIDEATNPLALLAVGLYGREMPPQNGAPIRLVVPWKYGFKSIKSIVRVHFTSKRPKTTWSQIAPNEYGFYANVNPTVDHPRWSQARERRLPTSLLNPTRIDTQMFNGYAEQVAYLYKGMDLRKYY